MNLKRTAAATVIAFGIGLPAPTTATGLLNAAPPGPPRIARHANRMRMVSGAFPPKNAGPTGASEEEAREAGAASRDICAVPR